MEMSDIKEKIFVITDDIKGGLEIMERYVLKRDTKSKLVLEDTEKGVRLFDKENSFSKEYSLVKLAVALTAAITGLVFIAVSLSNSINRKKVIKAQKKELKRLRKLCKGAGIDTKARKK